jgi:hypothetical protein
MTITVLNRQLVQTEIKTFLTTDFATYAGVVAGSKLVHSIFDYMEPNIKGASPVILVLGGDIGRKFDGVGSNVYDNEVGIELHVLVYAGLKANPLTPQQIEQTANQIEYCIALSCRSHRRGTYYQNLYRAGLSKRTKVIYLDGEKYEFELIKLTAKAGDYDS